MSTFGSELTEDLIKKLRESGDNEEADRILVEEAQKYSSLSDVKKPIKFPTEIPEDKFIDVRDERGELVRFVELDWMKQTIKALSE
jgi:hypothetical protein